MFCVWMDRRGGAGVPELGLGLGSEPQAQTHGKRTARVALCFNDP
jgi:hypothetical protein